MTDINQYDYYCPKCTKILSDKNLVMFNVVRNNNQEAKLAMNPKPGSYDFVCDPQLSFEKDELVDFYCPHCNVSLASEKFNKFIQIHLKITDKVLLMCFFLVFMDHIKLMLE